MNRKLKLALLALLGFSTACSSVKNAPKQGNDTEKQEKDSVVVRGYKGNPRIIAMYGVRPPQERLKMKPFGVDSVSTSSVKSQIPELDPVTEKIED